MSDLPTLVFIPGSWHKASCYSKITTPLEQEHGFRCISVTLPSTLDNPSATFSDDLSAARSAILGETASGRNVVVLAHSYGGMIGSSAVKDLATPTDLAHGHVVGLVLIASGFTLTGLAFMDPFFGRPPPYWRVNKESGYAELVADPRELFYHDVEPGEREFWVGELTTQSLKALFEGGEHVYAGWRDVDTWYLGTAEDRGLPVVVQRLAVGAAREMGASVVHRELPTSHSPFLSRPGETVEVILEAVDAFMGNLGKGQRGVTARSSQAMVPAVKLLWPITWYRFGLPLAFGHFLGRTILTFGWFRRMLGYR